MKITEPLTVHQQQLLVDGILELACKAGIIKSRKLVTDGAQVLMLLEDMAEFLSMERGVKYLTEGIIMPQGSCWGVTRDEVDERTGRPREVKTSRVITKPGATHIDEFETLNTVYRAVPGVTFEDLRVQPDEED